MKLLQASYAFAFFAETLKSSPSIVSNKFLKDLNIRPWAFRFHWRFFASTNVGLVSFPQDCKSKIFKFKASILPCNCKSSPSTPANSPLRSLTWFKILWSSVATSPLAFERDDKRSYDTNTSFSKIVICSCHSVMHVASCSSCPWWLWMCGWAMAFVWVSSSSFPSRLTPS